MKKMILILAALDWDESLAREIQFRMFMPWGFQDTSISTKRLGA